MSDEEEALLAMLARNVQRIVPKQPWGRDGDNPVPLQIFFNWEQYPEPWSVKFVIGLRNTQRRWSYARGTTLQQTLERALSQSRGGS